MVDPDRKNISLVLGSGGARGHAHIGVIRALEEHGFSIRLKEEPRRCGAGGECFCKSGVQYFCKSTNPLWSSIGLFERSRARGGVEEPEGTRSYRAVAPLSGVTIRELTLTGSKFASVSWVKQVRSSSFQRVSGVPMSPPLIPLSARMMP